MIILTHRRAKNGKRVFRVNVDHTYRWFEDRDWAWLFAYKAAKESGRSIIEKK